MKRWLLVPVFVFACAANAAPKVVYIVGGVWDKRTAPVRRGLAALSAQLDERFPGTVIDIVHNSKWKRLCEQLAADRTARMHDSLVLIGHSLGGQAVMDVSRCLERRDLEVELAITLDPMQKFFHAPVGEVPENIVRNANFYQRRDALHRGHGKNHRRDGSIRGITNEHVEPPREQGAPHEALVQTVAERGFLIDLIGALGTEHPAPPALAPNAR